jgi:hypothetical protein
VRRWVSCRQLLYLGGVAAIAASVGCGTRNVEVLSSTTTPTGVAASPSGAPAAAILVTGVIESINATSRSIVVSGTTVSVPSTATVRNRIGSLAFADLQVGQTVTIQASRTGSTITALDIFIDNSPGAYVQLEGQVSGLTGACPSLMFTVSGTTVVTVASTIDGSCAHIVNGAAVQVSGMRQTDGFVTASEVVVLQVQAAGSIAALQGSCPSITFSLGSTVVSTGPATLFAGRACSQLSDGAVVRVDGYGQSNGSIAATSVNGSSR